MCSSLIEQSVRVKRFIAGSALLIGAALVVLGLVLTVVAAMSMGGGTEVVLVGLVLAMWGVIVLAVSASTLRALRRGARA